MRHPQPQPQARHPHEALGSYYKPVFATAPVLQTRQHIHLTKQKRRHLDRKHALGLLGQDAGVETAWAELALPESFGLGTSHIGTRLHINLSILRATMFRR